MDARQRYIHIEKIKLLYLHSLAPAVLSGIAAVFLVIALWSYVPHTKLMIWLGATITLALLRITLILQFKWRKPQEDSILAWERPFTISLLIVFLMWGIGLPSMMPRDNLTAIFIVNTFAVGLACAAISWYSPISHIQIGAISIALLPMITMLLTFGHTETFWVGIAAFFLFISCIITSIILQHTLNGNLELTYDLEQSIQNTERIAFTDMLTGLKNRRAFFEEAITQFAKCKATDTPISLIMFDVDHFKKVNDEFGHATGDLVLRHVANLVKSHLRNIDICARLGGEEFAILLPDSTSDEAQIVAEKIRTLMINTPTNTEKNNRIEITASFGVADVGKSIDEMLNYADQAMYQAKNAGRNLVGVYSPTTAFISENPVRTRPSDRQATKIKLHSV